MVCYLPIPSPFVRLAGYWVDEALSFAMGWNFFLTMGTSISLLVRGIRTGLTHHRSPGNPLRNRRPQCSPHLLDGQSPRRGGSRHLHGALRV
jgi:hypothetical protein